MWMHDPVLQYMQHQHKCNKTIPFGLPRMWKWINPIMHNNDTIIIIIIIITAQLLS